ncbi:MAG: lipopolysaccharide biosynthesis protein [Candidatus Omnitrophica bacterium]|nr:lipopolysaccharide biosynthesis protein [Candidatus Omnitrophota bacterium]
MNIIDKNMSQPSRRKGTVALMATSYISFALVMVKGICLVPLYIKYIDLQIYGAWLATGSIIAYFGLLQFGMSGVIIQRVASAYGEKDYERLGFILGAGLPVGLLLSSLPIILGIILAPWVPSIVNITGIESTQIKLAFILAAFGTSLMIAMYIVGGTLVALQRQLVHGMFLVMGDILGVVTTIVLLTSGYGILAIPAGTLVWALISAFGDGLYLLWFMRNRLSNVRIRFRKRELKDISIQSTWQFFARSTSTIARQSDNLIVAILMGPSFCVLLTLTKRASEMTSRLIMYFVGSFFPGLAHLHGEDDLTKFKEITLLLFKVTSFFGIGLMGSYLFFNDRFMNLWVGSKFFGGFMLTGLFYIYGLLLILVTLFYNVIFSKGEIITTARANIAEAFVRIPLCFVLVKFLGIKGAVMTGILAILPTTFWIQAKKTLELINFTSENILNIMRTLILQILTSLIIGFILRGFWNPVGVVEFIYCAALYLIMVFSVCIFFDKELLLIVLNTTKRFLRKYKKKEEAKASIGL